MKKRISLLLILLLAFGNISFILSQTEYNLIYDANGNLISGFGLNYSYNGFNQLINITDSSDGSLVEEYFMIMKVVESLRESILQMVQINQLFMLVKILCK